MNPARSILFGSLATLAALVGLLFWNQRTPPSPRAVRPLEVFCAAGIKVPFEAAARDYEREYGIPVQLQFGGSGTLLNNLKVAHRGDLFVAADSSFVALGRSNQLLAEVLPLARQVPVLAVARGNPRNLTNVSSLLAPGIRISLANPDATAIGTLTRAAFTHSGHWAPLSAQATVFKPTVNDVANDVKLGAVDAGIVWDATVHQYPELAAVPLSELAGFSSEVAVCVLNASTQPRAALHFARYAAARDRGLRRFAETGYTPANGDVWADRPEVLLFSGTVNRVAIEPTLREFEEREGAQVTRVYNGCGILTAQIRSGQHPDAYFACDVSFMDTVTNYFRAPLDLAETSLVILVQKGNPAKVTQLADLARPGLRVGLAHEQQSALGALSARLLRPLGLYDRILANVSVQAPTGDLLLNQIRSGGLDAVLVYEVNASQVRDLVDRIPIEGPRSLATQPFAVGLNSDHAQLMERLLTALQTPTSRDRFEQSGFRWKAPASRP